MKDERFSPVRQQIDPGATVVWQNVGSTSHVVDSIQFYDTADEWQFRTQALRPGDSAVYTFDDEEIYELGFKERTHAE